MAWTVAVGALLAAGGSVMITMNLVGWVRERRELWYVLRSVVPDGRISHREDLVALRRGLAQRIRYDTSRMHAPRPLLRASAGQTLASGYGFCGENARVSIRLLRLAGVRAHRLYLLGARWGHVVVECWWEGDWRLFDAHADPATAPADDEVGFLPTDDVDRLPNRATENPWRAASTSKFLTRLPALARWRPPGIAVEVVESPHLIRTLLGGLLLGAGLALLLG